ncbi:helix-turn-helix domain-containing protein [Vibrio sp.]|uniref:helix-turn-helix domain-containing protein n=1 Tax=Vibrio sp. TaxID=678 RepID=UPI003D113B4B
MLLTRTIEINNNSFKFRIFSKRYHVISIKGAIGYLSYSGCVVKIPHKGSILIPKNSLVHCALKPLNEIGFSVQVFRLEGIRQDIFMKLNYDIIAAISEVEEAELNSKQVIIEVLYDKLRSSLFNRNRVSDNSYSGRVFSVIRKDLKKKWEIGDVCSVLYLSKTTLYRRLKEEKTSLSELLSTARMAKAAHLLKNSRLSISVISDKCGFNSTSYFCKKFKESYGATPTLFRTFSNSTAGHHSRAESLSP